MDNHKVGRFLRQCRIFGYMFNLDNHCMLSNKAATPDFMMRQNFRCQINITMFHSQTNYYIEQKQRYKSRRIA